MTYYGCLKSELCHLQKNLSHFSTFNCHKHLWHVLESKFSDAHAQWHVLTWYKIIKKIEVNCVIRSIRYRCGSRIWEVGVQLLRPNVADVAQQSHASRATNLWLVSRACLRTLEAFGFLMLKYAFSHILETLFLSHFGQLVQHQKLIQIAHCTVLQSIWEYFYILHPFF